MLSENNAGSRTSARAKYVQKQTKRIGSSRRGLFMRSSPKQLRATVNRKFMDIGQPGKGQTWSHPIRPPEQNSTDSLKYKVRQPHDQVWRVLGLCIQRLRQQ